MADELDPEIRELLLEHHRSLAVAPSDVAAAASRFTSSRTRARWLAFGVGGLAAAAVALALVGVQEWAVRRAPEARAPAAAIDQVERDAGPRHAVLPPRAELRNRPAPSRSQAGTPGDDPREGLVSERPTGEPAMSEPPLGEGAADQRRAAEPSAAPRRRSRADRARARGDAPPPAAAPDATAARVQSTLRAEVALLRRAESQLRAGSVERARALLETHATRFPNGTLAAERRRIQKLLERDEP